MRICENLGGMTLAEMMDRMSAAEVSLWRAEFALRAEEEDERRRDAALLARAEAAARKKL